MRTFNSGTKLNNFLIKSLFSGIGFVLLLSGFNQNTFAQIGAIGSIDEAAAGGGINEPVKRTQTSDNKTTSATNSKSSKSKSKNTVTQTKPKTAAKTKAQAKDNGFVIGDKYSFLNGEVTEMVRPVYRKAARDAGAVGLVQVEVLIDPNGEVISAKARTGNALLHPEAEKAALATKFNKPSLYGKPAKAFGFIVFRFGTEEDEYRMKQNNKVQ